MIVTATPNPSIDRTITVERLLQGEVNRALASRVDPGGKGVNVSRALAANGMLTQAVLPLGGPDGRLLADLLNASDVKYAGIQVAGAIRSNVAIVDPEGLTTKVNEPGPKLSEAELAAFRAKVLSCASNSAWLALCGSLPQGAPDELLAEIVQSHSGPTAVDTSGAALKCAIEAKPALIKPNQEELAELVGIRLVTLADALEACEYLVSEGVGTVIASLGVNGAIAVSKTGRWFASARVENPLSTVGAGDCLLAGALGSLSRGSSLAQALETAVSWGSAAVSLPGSEVPNAINIVDIEVESQWPKLSTSLVP